MGRAKRPRGFAAGGMVGKRAAPADMPKSKENPYPKEDPFTDPTRGTFIGTRQLDAHREEEGYRNPREDSDPDGKVRQYARGGVVDRHGMVRRMPKGRKAFKV